MKVLPVEPSSLLRSILKKKKKKKKKKKNKKKKKKKKKKKLACFTNCDEIRSTERKT